MMGSQIYDQASPKPYHNAYHDNSNNPSGNVTSQKITLNSSDYGASNRSNYAVSNDIAPRVTGGGYNE